MSSLKKKKKSCALNHGEHKGTVALLCPETNRSGRIMFPHVASEIKGLLPERVRGVRSCGRAGKLSRFQCPWWVTDELQWYWRGAKFYCTTIQRLAADLQTNGPSCCLWIPSWRKKNRKKTPIFQFIQLWDMKQLNPLRCIHVKIWNCEHQRQIRAKV